MIDFDGTITERDTLEMLVDKFGDPDAQRRAESELGRGLSLHDVIAAGYGSLRGSRIDVIRWASANVRVRPGLPRLINLAARRQWRVAVVSSGVRELIEALLRREGMQDLELICNSLADEPEWRVLFRDNDACDVCGEPCKRRSIIEFSRDGEVVYIGDGYSDGCAALVADRVFARRRLANFLERRGVRFHRFNDFFEVAEKLAGAPVSFSRPHHRPQ